MESNMDTHSTESQQTVLSAEAVVASEIPAESANRIIIKGFSNIPEDLELTFIDKVPQSVLCSKCSILGPSLWRFQCGHGFCNSCFDHLMPREIAKTICPIDQQSIARMSVFQDSSVQETSLPLRALCPYNCGETVRMCTLAGHLQFCNNLQKQILKKRCFLRGLGCTFEGEGEALEKHEEDLKPHRDFIARKIRELSTIDDLRNQVNEALAALVEATQNQRELKNRVIQLESEVEELRDRPRASTSNGVTTSAPPAAPNPTFSFKLGPMAITTYGGELPVPTPNCVTAGRRGAQELVCPDGVFQWKLSEYAKAKFKEPHRHKKYTSSPTFYAGNPGYLMRLRLHLHGIGSGKGKYMSVGIVLAKGDHDAALPWPIHNPITVTLIDPTKKNPDVEYMLRDPCFPQAKGDYIVPYVWHEFITSAELESKYVHNDSITLRIHVHQPGTTNGVSTSSMVSTHSINTSIGSNGSAPQAYAPLYPTLD